MRLSAESSEMCKTGPFEEKDLVDFLPALAPLIVEHGEHSVIERCQIARANTATAAFAIECVFSYFKADAQGRVFSEMARRAMTKDETATGQNAASMAILRSITSGSAAPPS